MGALGWVLLGLLSAAPSLLLGLGDPFDQWVPAGASLYGLSLLPWLALGGLPTNSPAEADSEWSLARTLFPLAVALPALGLAAGLDLAQGRMELGQAASWPLLLGGPLLVWVWRLSAVAGRRSQRAFWAHTCLWGMLLPLSSAFLVALDWAPASAATAGPPMAAGWRVLNPLLWCFERSGHAAQWGSSAAEASAWALLMGSAALVWGLVTSLGRRPEL